MAVADVEEKGDENAGSCVPGQREKASHEQEDFPITTYPDVLWIVRYTWQSSSVFLRNELTS